MQHSNEISDKKISRREAISSGAGLALTGLIAGFPFTTKASNPSNYNKDQMKTLEGKVALITGAARGIGRSTAQRLARAGADILAVDIAKNIPEVNYDLASEEDLQETKRLVETEGRNCIIMKADVRHFRAMQKAVEISRTELGGLHIVVANAGLTVYGQMLSTITDNQFKTVIDVNLVGAANTLRAAIPHLTEQKSGRIILVSSGAGRMGMPGLAHYSASKWGMFGLMKSAALEIADSSVTVNIVAPGPVETPMADNQAVYSAFVPNNNNPTREDFLDVLAQSNPIPVPWLQPENIAEAIYFFTTDAVKQVTGTSLEISPGEMARNNA